jgi:propionyl-CoA carboxylase alpha chain
VTPPSPRRVATLLVANRGEIARRVLRAAHDLGMRTVAVCSDADRDEPFAHEADVTVPLGGSTASESYLDVDRVLAAARHAGADAVHPGYGFLAESADAARRVEAAGLVWIGPPPQVIARLGDKLEAKRLAVATGLPTLPSAELVGDADFEWRRQAAAVGYPLLVKAAAGGGGKGMRIVTDEAGLANAVTAARREAEASFGDPTVFAERHLARARHVEVQVAADATGQVIHLAERECSIQRRHQKLVEEAPSPAVDAALRARLGAAATTLAAAAGYVTVGTVEFLVDDETGEFSFLEMNTRLQVEHPVTEAVTGVDLVALQIALATGARLPIGQDDVTLTGHAVEARLYAEDPARGWLPSSGTIHRYQHDGHRYHHGRPEGMRYEDGVATGSVVTTLYDPLLAKVIAHGPTRAVAVGRLARAIDGLVVEGVTTNADHLVAVLRHPDFLAGATTTTFVDDHADLLAADDGPGVDVAAVVLAGRARRHLADPHWGFAPAGWRNVGPRTQRVTLAGGRAGDDRVLDVAYEVDDDDRFVVELSDPDGGAGDDPTARLEGRLEGRLVGVERDGDDDRVRLEVDGTITTHLVHAVGPTSYVRGPRGHRTWTERPRFPTTGGEAAGGGPTAPVPGRVVAVEVVAGAEVTAGRTLVIMEAMKVEHRISSPVDGIVADVLVAVGDQVDAHQLLVRIEERP